MYGALNFQKGIYTYWVPDYIDAILNRLRHWKIWSGMLFPAVFAEFSLIQGQAKDHQHTLHITLMQHIHNRYIYIILKTTTTTPLKLKEQMIYDLILFVDVPHKQTLTQLLLPTSIFC